VSDILFFREDKRPRSTVHRTLEVRERPTFIILLFTKVHRRPIRIVFGHKLCVTTYCARASVYVCACVWVDVCIMRVCVCVYVCYCRVDGTANNPLRCSSSMPLLCENSIVIVELYVCADDRTSDGDPSEIDNNGK